MIYVCWFLFGIVVGLSWAVYWQARRLADGPQERRSRRIGHRAGIWRDRSRMARLDAPRANLDDDSWMSPRPDWTPADWQRFLSRARLDRRSN
jgi:hypothetical protein